MINGHILTETTLHTIELGHWLAKLKQSFITLPNKHQAELNSGPKTDLFLL